MSDLARIAWPRERLGDALSALGEVVGGAASVGHPGEIPAAVPVSDWLELAAARLGLEAEPIATPYRALDGLIEAAGPALLALPEGGTVALVRVRRRRALVIAPDLRRRWVPVATLRSALAASAEAEARPALARLLEDSGVAEARRERVISALLADSLGGTPCRGGWLLRLPPSAAFADQMRAMGLERLAMLLVASHALHQILFVAAWATIGRGALEGGLDGGWLFAWALALATQVPLGMASAWLEGRFAIGTSTLLKRRMLQGALRLSPEETRSEGVGRFVARVNEAEALEALALGGGLTGALAAIELVIAAGVLALGVGGALHVGLLLGWLVLLGLVVRGFAARHRAWTDDRVDLTLGLVERMVGHRTRLAQEPPERWHVEEDRDLRRYLGRSRSMDRWAVWLSMLGPGWLAVGLLGLAPAFVRGADPIGVAVALGGVLLAQGAVVALTGGLVQCVGARVAWQRVRPLFEAAARPESTGPPGVALSPAGAEAGPIVAGLGLGFRFRERGRAVLDGCSVEIADGDRILLEGPSGGGKSTLAALLAGLREPDEGLLLLRGLDRATLGEAGWRRRVVAAPQFHENHVLSASFAFNLLMGQAWPATPEDLARAETICRELGLGALLDRMPAGMQQRVGDTGWQLSHGERSRLQIARALVQRADLVVLDESFASLDPENLERALDCARRHANALLVVAHP